MLCLSRVRMTGADSVDAIAWAVTPPVDVILSASR
jgi:hypothetical protein